MDTIDIILLVFLLLFSIIIVIIIFICINGSKIQDVPSTEIKFIDPNSINTGDIVVVGYRNVFGKILKGITSSIWSHSGIAYRDPNTNFLYIIELGVYKKYYKGIFKIPFHDWIKYNRKHYLGILTYNGPTIDIKKFDEIFDKYKLYNIDPISYKWLRFLYKSNYRKINKNTYTCIELTISILQELDIYKKKYLSSSYFPRDIANNNIPTINTVFYNNVKLFKYYLNHDDGDFRRC